MARTLVDGQETPFSEQFRQVLSDSLGRVIGPLGCQCVGVDVISTDFASL
jgi:hypothetical protein